MEEQYTEQFIEMLTDQKQFNHWIGDALTDHDEETLEDLRVKLELLDHARVAVQVRDTHDNQLALRVCNMRLGQFVGDIVLGYLKKAAIKQVDSLYQDTEEKNDGYQAGE